MNLGEEDDDRHKVSQSSSETPAYADDRSQDIDRIASELDCWREILVHADRILNWENPRVLGLILCILTVIFFFIWLIGPSLLTSFALIGLFVNAIDFAVPVLAPKYFDRSAWTSLEEQHFHQICSRLGNVRFTAIDTLSWLRLLRHDRPTFYFTIMTVFYFILAIVGERINGLLLTYLVISVALVTPGMIRHGVLAHLRNQLMKVINDKMGKKTNKTN